MPHPKRSALFISVASLEKNYAKLCMHVHRCSFPFRRLQQQIKAGAERVAELEGQVSFLERQRVDVWASATAGGALGGSRGGSATNRLSKAASATTTVTPGVAVSLSRSMNGAPNSAGLRKSANNGAAPRARGAGGGTLGATPVNGHGSGAAAAAAGDDDEYAVAAETAFAEMPRWPTEHAHENGHGHGTGAAASRDGWERGGNDADLHPRSHGGGGPSGLSGGASTGVGGPRQTGEEYVGRSPSSTRANGITAPGSPQYENGPGWGQGQQQQHRRDRQAGSFDGGRDAHWGDEAVGVERERYVGDENSGRPGGGGGGSGSGGGVPWQVEHAGARRDPDDPAPPTASRMRGGAAVTPSDRFQRMPGESEERRFDDHHGHNHHPRQQQQPQQQPQQQQQPSRQHELGGDATPVGQDGGGSDDRGTGNGNVGNMKPPLNSSWGGRRLAASSDGVKYDPMRYEKAIAFDDAAVAERGGGGTAATYPDHPPQGERESGGGGGGGGGGGESGRALRSSSSDNGRAAAAAAAALDRTSYLRHSDAGGVRVRERSDPRSAESYREAATAATAAAAAGAGAAGDVERQAEAGVYSSVGPQGWGRRTETPPVGDTRREERRETHDSSAFAGDGERPSTGQQQHHQHHQAATTQTLEAPGQRRMSHSTERERTRVVPGTPAAPPAAADFIAPAVGGAGMGVPAGSGGGGGRGKVEHVLRDGRRVILFANGTQKVCRGGR